MIGPFKPKAAMLMGKRPETQDYTSSETSIKSDAMEFAASRLIEAISAKDPKSVLSAMKNLYALMESEDDSEET